MRFAASPGFLGAYGLADTFDPSGMVDTGMQGRALGRITDMDMDAKIREKELMGEAMVEKAGIMAEARAGAVPGVGDQLLRQGLGLAGDIFSSGGGVGGDIFAQKGAEAFTGAQGLVDNTIGNVGSFMGSLY